MPLAAAIPAAIGAVGSIVGGITQRDAAKTASTSLANSEQKVIDLTGNAVNAGQGGVNTATGNANDILTNSAQQQLGLLAPYLQPGQDSLGTLQQLAGAGGPLDQKFQFNPSDLQNDPGYQFTLQQGQQALQRAAAAKGNLFSAGTLKSIGAYTTGTANTYLNDAFNRAATTFDINRSSALSRIGTLQNLVNTSYGAAGSSAAALRASDQQRAQNTFGAGQFNANLGLQGADVIGRAVSNQGAATAAGQVGAANATTGMIGGVTNSLQGIASLLARRYANNSPSGAGSSSSSSPIFSA